MQKRQFIANKREERGGSKQYRLKQQEETMRSKRTKKWDPLPEEFNRAWQIDVLRLEDYRVRKGALLIRELTIVIAAYWGHAHEQTTGAWNIVFNNVTAYSRRYFDDIPSHTLPRPDVHSGLWEIAMPKHSPQPTPLHHYVIFSYDVVYEVIAESWAIAALPNEWAKPFEFPLP